MADNQNDIKSISISVTAKTAQAQRQLEGLVSTLEKIATTAKSIDFKPESIEKFTSAMQALNNANLKQLPLQLARVSTAMKGISTSIDTQKLNAMAKFFYSLARLRQAANQQEKMAQSAQRLAVAQQNANTAAEKQKRLQQALDQGTRERTSKQVEAAEKERQAAADKEAAKAQREFAKLVEESDKQAQKSLETTINLIDRFEKSVAKSFAVAGAAVARFSAIVGKELLHSFTFAAKGALKLTAAIGLAPWKRLANSVKSTVFSLKQFLSSVKRIAVYRAIRWALKAITQAFKEGIDNLYQYSLLIDGKFMHSMDMLATASLYVKNSMAAMVSPIINEVAPAIDFLADKFVDLLNTVNETVAAMTGAETWTKAIKYPTEYAEAADDANASAKKLRNTLLGFDEINRLDDKSKSKRGSSGSALDYSKMFEEKQVTKNAKSFVKTLKDAFKSGDLTSIGESLGKNLLDGLNKIPWEDIKRNVKRNAKSVATLINGFIDVPDLGYTIGKSIAAAFNTAVAKMNEFFGTVSWGKIGTFLANGLNGAIQNFDINELARGVALRINGIATMIKNFTKEVKWGNVATFLTNGIMTAIKEIKIGELTGAIAGVFKTAIDLIGKVAQTVEWEKLGAWLADGVNSIFDKFDTDPPIAESLANVFNAAVKTIGSYADNVKWEKIGTFLADNVNSFLETFEIKDLGKTLAKLVNKGFSLLKNFVSEVEWSKIGTFLSDGINGFFDEINTKDVGETISKSVVGALVAVKDFFKKTDFEEIGKKVGEILSELDWVEILKGLVSVLTTALGSAFDFLKGVWEKDPAGAIVLGTAFASLLSTAFGLPSVASLIVDGIASLVGSGIATGAAAQTAGSVAAGAAQTAGSVASGATTMATGFASAALPVMLIGVAAAAALVIWKMQDKKAEKNIGALEPYAGAIQDELTDPELYKQRMYNLSLGRDLDTKLTEYEKTLADLGAGLPKTTKTGSFELPDLNIGKNNYIDPNNITINAAFNTDDISYMIENGIFNDKEWNDYVRKISSIDTNTKTTADKSKSIKEYLLNIKDTIWGSSEPTSPSGAAGSRTYNSRVPRAASGGTFTTGSVFLAGEAGAEIIASQGGKTTVHNRDQIAESVAIGSEEGNALLRQLVNVGNKILAKDTSVVTQITTGDITTAMDRQNRREGRSVVPVALGG